MLVAVQSKQFLSLQDYITPSGPGKGCEETGSEHNVSLIKTFGVEQSRQWVELHLKQSVTKFAHNVQTVPSTKY